MQDGGPPSGLGRGFVRQEARGQPGATQRRLLHLRADISGIRSVGGTQLEGTISRQRVPDTMDHRAIQLEDPAPDRR